MSGGRPSLYRLYKCACFFEAAAAATAAASSSLSSPLPNSLPAISSVHEQRSLTRSPSLYQLRRPTSSAAEPAASSSSSSPLPISRPTISSVDEQRSLTMSGPSSLHQLYTSVCSAAAAASSSSSSSSSSSRFPIFPSRRAILPKDTLMEIFASLNSNYHVRLNGFFDLDGILMSPEVMQRVADRGGQGNSLLLLIRMPSGSFHLLRRLLFSNNEFNPEEDFQAVTIPYLPEEIRQSVPRWPVQIGRCLLAGAARGCAALFIDLVSSGERINNPTFITLFTTVESETGVRMLQRLEERFHRCPVLLAFIERGDRNPLLMIANEATENDPSIVLFYDWGKKAFKEAEIRAPLNEISPMEGLTARAVNLRKTLYWITVGGRQITTYSDTYKDGKVGKGGKCRKGRKDGKDGKDSKDGKKKITCQFGQHPLPPGREKVDDIFVMHGELMALTSTEALEIWRWNGGSWDLHRILSQNPSGEVRFVGSFRNLEYLIAVWRPEGFFRCECSFSENTTLQFSFSHDALRVDETDENLFLFPTKKKKKKNAPPPPPPPPPSPR